MSSKQEVSLHLLAGAALGAGGVLLYQTLTRRSSVWGMQAQSQVKIKGGSPSQPLSTTPRTPFSATANSSRFAHFPGTSVPWIIVGLDTSQLSVFGTSIHVPPKWTIELLTRSKTKHGWTLAATQLPINGKLANFLSLMPIDSNDKMVPNFPTVTDSLTYGRHDNPPNDDEYILGSAVVKGGQTYRCNGDTCEILIG
jgi:hypothetical protein